MRYIALRIQETNHLNLFALCRPGARNEVY
jgi:hypothetical protein